MIPKKKESFFQKKNFYLKKQKKLLNQMNLISKILLKIAKLVENLVI